MRGARDLSGPRQHHMLGEGRQSSLSTASTYFIHIFVNFSANGSFAHVFIDNHTKSKVISVIFRGEHRKTLVELLSTFTIFFFFMNI